MGSTVGIQKARRLRPTARHRGNTERFTEKQRVFCQEYLKGFNATQAATIAGYAPKSAMVQGCKLLKIDKVKEQIEALKAQKEEKWDIEVEDIVQSLKDGLRMAKAKGNLSAMARFLELLGRYKAMYTDRVQSDTSLEIVINRPKTLLKACESLGAFEDGSKALLGPVDGSGPVGAPVERLSEEARTRAREAPHPPDPHPLAGTG